MISYNILNSIYKLKYTINSSEKQYADRIVIGMIIWIFMTAFWQLFVVNMI